MSDIRELVKRLEAATEGSSELDDAIAQVAHVGSKMYHLDTGAEVWRGPNYTRSIDAAMLLVPERGTLDLFWRVFLERKPVNTGPAWFAEVREHAKVGAAAIANTSPLALVVAALRARFTEAQS